MNDALSAGAAWDLENLNGDDLLRSVKKIPLIITWRNRRAMLQMAINAGSGSELTGYKGYG